MTAYISTVDAKEEFSELLSRVAHNKERIVLIKRGKEIAAIVPLEDLQFLQTQQVKHDLEDALSALQEARSQGTITLDQLKEEVG